MEIRDAISASVKNCKANRFRSDSSNHFKGQKDTGAQATKIFFISIINFANTAFGFPVISP